MPEVHVEMYCLLRAIPFSRYQKKQTPSVAKAKLAKKNYHTGLLESIFFNISAIILKLIRPIL